MKLFWTYVKQRRTGILSFLLFGILFFAAFALYGLPMEAVGYPALLCALFGIFFLTADYAKMRRKHRRLLEMRELSAATLMALPEAAGVLEEDYQNLLLMLKEEVLNQKTDFSQNYQETVEYYTAWVHQIKTPIASMHLTLEKEDTPASRKLSSDLFRIEQYVEMVLAYLRLDMTGGDYVFKEYSVDEIVKGALKKFASEFIDRKLKLIYEPVNTTVVTDEKWLSFVVEQILSNALKYTRKGSIRIYLKEPKTLCIEDTGMGIAPEDLPRIFEKGYTGYNGRKDKRASGIGLYLCRRICNNLGVKIEVESEPEKGTKVCLHLEQYEIKCE